MIRLLFYAVLLCRIDVRNTFLFGNRSIPLSWRRLLIEMAIEIGHLFPAFRNLKMLYIGIRYCTLSRMVFFCSTFLPVFADRKKKCSNAGY